jgi:hypothetical protein
MTFSGDPLPGDGPLREAVEEAGYEFAGQAYPHGADGSRCPEMRYLNTRAGFSGYPARVYSIPPQGFLWEFGTYH